MFAPSFTDWGASLEAINPDADLGPEIVALDGKTSRRTHDRAHDRTPLHLVSAWPSGQRPELGQQACAATSNEITAIPLLLDRLAMPSVPMQLRHHPPGNLVLLCHKTPAQFGAYLSEMGILTRGGGL